MKNHFLIFEVIHNKNCDVETRSHISTQRRINKSSFFSSLYRKRKRLIMYIISIAVKRLLLVDTI